MASHKALLLHLLALFSMLSMSANACRLCGISLPLVPDFLCPPDPCKLRLRPPPPPPGKSPPSRPPPRRGIPILPPPILQ
ncbi:unnamed protein product [Coffea canephora]|uniref:Uncharacterized protein n=1 Tax=Coffea canephora TaxID=49390 RepID=A0A068UH52_COFCA|nr:unnamed protein product [Coffea canephora]